MAYHKLGERRSASYATESADADASALLCGTVALHSTCEGVRARVRRAINVYRTEPVACQVVERRQDKRPPRSKGRQGSLSRVVVMH